MDTIKRKRRSDRNHLIYKITNTITQETYIGLTVVSNGTKKSLMERWKRHVQRALYQNKTWNLCESIRIHGETNFKQEVLQVVRGRALAHQTERSLIRDLNSTLNTV